ncbi:WD repeat-containing protein 1-B-like [Acanthaster planci]|uniref:Actin-interacting protein 1 n=1 Tax=Acanthaster planci TaxID=133434 RepID=A0A8B7YME3_ACAPL|nr:WD repeat-containing protein 1-B-like [Acanthaster planci]
MPLAYERKSVFASLPRTERARAFNLGGDPKGKNFLCTHDVNVFIRDIENPAICDIYCEHSAQTSVAKYAPSGFYIASGDVTGKLRIWDTTQKEHILKYEYQPISGKINDIAWSPDSKRIAVCGEGHEKFASVFLWDTGSTVGKIDASTKHCNAVDYRPTRPFRIVLASEDGATTFYEGPPFKYSKDLREHSKFVNTTRFSPDGNFFATGSSDQKVFMYTGKEGDLVVELKDGARAHVGGVYSVCFSPDSTRLLSASADKTVKMWDVETHQVITTFKLGDTIQDQQLSILWQGDYILSASLSGYINYLDKNNPDKPWRIVKGHNKNISTFALSSDASCIYSADIDCNVMCWNAETSECEATTGKSHTNMLMDMSTNGDTLVTVGMDDKIRFIDTIKKEFTDEVIGLDSQPQCVTSKGDLIVAGTLQDLCLFKAHNKVDSDAIRYEAKSAHLSPEGSYLAIGGSDSKIHIYDVAEEKLKEVDQLTTNEPVCALQFSPDGLHLAASSGKKVLLFKVQEFQPVENFWSGHSARINSLSWSPDSKRFASVGVDGSVGVWALDTLRGSNMILGAHPKTIITKVAWRDNTTIVSAGHDKCIKQWTV